jgi:uncharacterized membrane protein YccC
MLAPKLAAMASKRVISLWRLLRAAINRRRVQLGLALRVTVAAMLALAIAEYARLPLPLWAVMTAVVVTQVSLGRSLRATIDYLIGTLGGALYGGALAVLVPHASEPILFVVLAAAVLPLALMAAINPRLSVAPITAIIVLLVPAITHATPLASAIDRVFEVAVGAATGFLVSFVLLPSRAHVQVAQAAARTLDHMGRALRALLASVPGGLDTEALHRIQDGIGQSLERLRAIGAEAEQERAAHIATMPDTAPLLRTLMRLRHDLVMVGRASQTPLPEGFRSRLEAPLGSIADAAAEYMRGCGAALSARRPPPSLAPLHKALDRYAAEIAELRRDGATRVLAVDPAERFFALCFAFEQLRQNFRDLERCVTEWAQDKPAGA